MVDRGRNALSIVFIASSLLLSVVYAQGENGVYVRIVM